MDSADVIDTKKFQEGFSLGRKSKLSKAADEDSSKATSSFEGRKMERSHTFTDELDSHSGNSYGSYIFSLSSYAHSSTRS